jgi:hypothetical protein
VDFTSRLTKKFLAKWLCVSLDFIAFLEKRTLAQPQRTATSSHVADLYTKRSESPVSALGVE